MTWCRHWPSAVQVQKTWLEYLSGALGWAHRAPGGTWTGQVRDIRTMFRKVKSMRHKWEMNHLNVPVACHWACPHPWIWWARTQECLWGLPLAWLPLSLHPQWQLFPLLPPAGSEQRDESKFTVYNLNNLVYYILSNTDSVYKEIRHTQGCSRIGRSHKKVISFPQPSLCLLNINQFADHFHIASENKILERKTNVYLQLALPLPLGRCATHTPLLWVPLFLWQYLASVTHTFSNNVNQFQKGLW